MCEKCKIWFSLTRELNFSGSREVRNRSKIDAKTPSRYDLILRAKNDRKSSQHRHNIGSKNESKRIENELRKYVEKQLQKFDEIEILRTQLGPMLPPKINQKSVLEPWAPPKAPPGPLDARFSSIWDQFLLQFLQRFVLSFGALLVSCSKSSFEKTCQYGSDSEAKQLLKCPG